MLSHLPDVMQICCCSVIRDMLNTASRAVSQFVFFLKKKKKKIIYEDDVWQLLTVY